MAAGDSCVAERIALVKAGALDQPRRRKLYLAVLRRISGNASLFNAEFLGQSIKDGYRDDGVFEEAAGAAAIRISRHQEHAF